jgi:hypothetical protein
VNTTRLVLFAWWLLSCACYAGSPVEVVSEPWTPTRRIYTLAANELEPDYLGKPLSLSLKGTNSRHLTLKELLTLKQTGPLKKPGLVAFELPISYKALTNMGDLRLWMKTKGGEFTDCTLQGCEPAKNSNCLLSWLTTFDPFGQNQIQARLTVNSKGGQPMNMDDCFEVWGPVQPFYSSNVCQFTEGDSFFDSTGAPLFAILREQVASYVIDLKTVEGKHIKTITGSTTNGKIDVEWDLVDKRGRRFKKDHFVAVFHVTFPGQHSPNPPAQRGLSRIEQ